MNLHEFAGQKLPCVVKLPNAELIDFVKQIGSVWYGPVKKHVFISRFQTLLTNMLISLNEAGDIVNNKSYKIPHIDFTLNLVEQAIAINAWNWPAVIYNLNDWEYGNTRLLATGLTKSYPWLHYNMLAIGQTDEPDFIIEPTEIINSSDFNSALGILNWKIPTNIQPVIFMEVTEKKLLNIAFREIDHYKKNRTDSERDYFADYYEWYKITYPRPRIGIYTSWPEQITDTQKFWDFEILGMTPWVYADRPGALDFHVQMTKFPPGIDHILYVNNPLAIDLSQLLFWMDLKHNQYADTQWRFSLARRTNQIKTKFISVVDVDAMTKVNK
jgi:hypothetical protein